MTDLSPRLRLPLLQAGQAQKELFHNEALALLDLAAQPVAETLGDQAPPATPQFGQCWIVGDQPTGVWTGQAGALAGWTAGGWRFVAPVDGMSCWVRAAGLEARRTAGAWVLGTVAAAAVTINGVQVLGARRPAVAAPTGGTVVDGEARTALANILAVLHAHGLTS